MTEMRTRLRLVAPPWSQRRVEAHIAELRTALGAERFASVWAEGAAMTREGANTYAMETLEA
jgi:hypothetical protein